MAQCRVRRIVLEEWDNLGITNYPIPGMVQSVYRQIFQAAIATQLQEIQLSVTVHQREWAGPDYLVRQLHYHLSHLSGIVFHIFFKNSVRRICYESYFSYLF